MLSIPPTQALFDQFLIDNGLISKRYLSENTPLLVFAMSLERHVQSEAQHQDRLSRDIVIWLALHRTVDPVQAESLGFPLSRSRWCPR